MAFDAFLKIDGIEGESPDSKHSKEIQLLSFSFGADQPASSNTGGGAGTGKVNMHDLSVLKSVDKSSPKLLVACATGQHIKSAVLTARKAGGDQHDYMIVTLSDVIVSSVQTSGQANGSDGLPTEQMSLNFSKINFEYKEQGADGSLKGTVEGGFDVKTMKKV
jgi:type VI secretion system secreted protein Hcp